MGAGSTVMQTFVRAGEISGEIESFGGFRLYAKGLDASNTIKTQRSLDRGVTWSDVTTYNSDQSAVQISEATRGALHRAVCVAKQTTTGPIRVKLTLEWPTSDVA